MEGNKRLGHIAAAVTVLIWGTTFISTKVLLTSLRPVEILFFRFLLGLLALTAAMPKRLRGTTRAQECTFAAAGLCGITLYYLLENIALTYTLASNVGIIISVSPFFTAILSYIRSGGKEKLTAGFLVGFLLAMVGIGLISFGGTEVSLRPTGDILAVLAALVWAVYSLLTRRIGSFGYPVIQTTRRIFLYGLLWMLPALYLFDFRWDAVRLVDGGALLNLLFLGFGASALCFVTWSVAVERLGAVKTSIYIYMVPVITVTASALILREGVTGVTVLGIALTLGGLLLSELKINLRKRGNSDGSEREEVRDGPG